MGAFPSKVAATDRDQPPSSSLSKRVSAVQSGRPASSPAMIGCAGSTSMPPTRRDEAIYFTENLVRVWDGADPELAERLEAARQRLAALRAG